MKRLWGLAAAGSIGRSFICRLPKLALQLGPVASTSYRLAARLSNTLRAGTAVREFAALQRADIVLLCVPDGHLSPLVQVHTIDWTGKIVLFCDSTGNSAVRAEIRLNGGAVGSINQIPALPDRYFIVGDPAAVRFAKSLVQSVHGRAMEVPEERLLLFHSALTLSGSLFTPLLETAVECFRQSGLSQPEAAKLAESLFQHSLRTFKHAGRKSWTGPVALADEQALDAQCKALQVVQPLMASYFRDAVRYSLELYQTFPELTRYNKNRWRELRNRHHGASGP